MVSSVTQMSIDQIVNEVEAKIANRKTNEETHSQDFTPPSAHFAGLKGHRCRVRGRRYFGGHGSGGEFRGRSFGFGGSGSSSSDSAFSII